MELARAAPVKERHRVALLQAETGGPERDAQQAEAELLQVQQEIAQLAVLAVPFSRRVYILYAGYKQKIAGATD